MRLLNSFFIAIAVKTGSAYISFHESVYISFRKVIYECDKVDIFVVKFACFVRELCV